MSVDRRLDRLRAESRKLMAGLERLRVYVRYVDADGEGPNVPPEPGEPYREEHGPGATVVYAGETE